MAADLPAGAIHQYAPVDTAGAVRRFLSHWRPDLAVRVDSEIWPRAMVETARAGVPIALVNARLSARSARGWRRVPGMARALCVSPRPRKRMTRRFRLTRYSPTQPAAKDTSRKHTP